MSRLKEALSKNKAALPPRLPTAEEWVIYWFGEPMDLGTEAIPLLCKVISVHPESGSLNGWAFMDPMMEFRDPQGRPVQAPPMVPVKQSTYAENPRKGGWTFMETLREPSAVDEETGSVELFEEDAEVFSISLTPTATGDEEEQ